MYKLKNFNPVNNRNYVPNMIIDTFKSYKSKINTELVNYTVKDESMEPEIAIGQSVVLLKRNYIFNEKDIYLILTPYCEMVRRLKMISDESIKLIASNKRCNNEVFLIEDVQIIGKVKIVWISKPNKKYILLGFTNYWRV